MKIWISMFSLALGLTASGCLVDVDHPGGHAAGDALFTVDWSVDGTDSARECDYFGARYANVTIMSSYGVEDEQEISCDAFGADFYLEPGRYWVEIVLLDRSGHEITETVETDSRYVEDGDYVVVDFPADSFL
jgi:hypothetical protein